MTYTRAAATAPSDRVRPLIRRQGLPPGGADAPRLENEALRRADASRRENEALRRHAATLGVAARRIGPFRLGDLAVDHGRRRVTVAGWPVALRPPLGGLGSLQRLDPSEDRIAPVKRRQPPVPLTRFPGTGGSHQRSKRRPSRSGSRVGAAARGMEAEPPAACFVPEGGKR